MKVLNFIISTLCLLTFGAIALATEKMGIASQQLIKPIVTQAVAAESTKSPSAIKMNVDQATTTTKSQISNSVKSRVNQEINAKTPRITTPTVTVPRGY